MQQLKGLLVSIQFGNNEDLSKESHLTARVELDGFISDKHRGASRVAYSGDREPKGTVLRNDRQWSGVSAEELAEISRKMDLSSVLSAQTLGANICIKGVPGFSLLPRGTRLIFPSGAALTIEEYNPPCADMGARVAATYTTRSGDPLEAKHFMRPAAGRRGVVGMVDVPGELRAGDEVIIEVFETPVIRLL